MPPWYCCPSKTRCMCCAAAAPLLNGALYMLAGGPPIIPIWLNGWYGLADAKGWCWPLFGVPDRGGGGGKLEPAWAGEMRGGGLKIGGEEALKGKLDCRGVFDEWLP